MSLSGIRPFSDAERDLFDKLMDLQQEGDRTGDYSKHDALAGKLTETQNTRYDEYIAVTNDASRKLWEIEQRKSEAKKQMTEAKAQRGVIFSQHASGFTNVLDKFTLSSQPQVVAANGAPSHTNGKKKFGW